MHYPNWICCQLGAREHYAIPRALHSRGVLARLVTDFWLSPYPVFSPKIGSLLMRDLQGRYHPDLANSDVEGLNFSALKFEIMSRILGQYGWAQTMARNEWFQRKVVACLSSSPLSVVGSQPILFAYSYAARDIFRFAKAQGRKTVLGQIDPGPLEEEIVAGEVARERDLGALWEPAPPGYWDLWREECDLADRIVVNSKWSRSALEKAGVSPAKIRAIPLAYERPAETNIFKRSYPDEFDETRPMRVLFLGQINLRKGVARLLKAIRLLENEPIEFQFVGPVQMSIPYNLRNNPRLRWFGAVSRSDVDTFYRSADVLIFPTLSDGFGLTQLEAQAWSLPIVASRFCGEVVRDGVNGIVLDELSPNAISTALRSCVCQAARLRSFAANAGLGEKFKLKTVAENLLGLFDSVA